MKTLWIKAAMAMWLVIGLSATLTTASSASAVLSTDEIGLLRAGCANNHCFDYGPLPLCNISNCGPKKALEICKGDSECNASRFIKVSETIPCMGCGPEQAGPDCTRGNHDWQFCGSDSECICDPYFGNKCMPAALTGFSCWVYVCR